MGRGRAPGSTQSSKQVPQGSSQARFRTVRARRCMLVMPILTPLTGGFPTAAPQGVQPINEDGEGADDIGYIRIGLLVVGKNIDTTRRQTYNT